MMPRFYSPVPVVLGAPCALSEDAAHHARAVLRLKPGDEVVLFDGNGGGVLAALLRVDKHGVQAMPQRVVQPHLPPEDVTLWFSPLKKDACAYLVQKSTELGVGALRPVRMQHTAVADFPVHKRRQTAINAAEQCRLTAVPSVHAQTPFADMLVALNDAESVLFCDETGGEAVLPALLRLHAESRTVRHIIIGPEGGFASAERAALRALPGAVPVSLGRRILRAETAAAAALTLVTVLRQ